MTDHRWERFDDSDMWWSCKRCKVTTWSLHAAPFVKDGKVMLRQEKNGSPHSHPSKLDPDCDMELVRSVAVE